MTAKKEPINYKLLAIEFIEQVPYIYYNGADYVYCGTHYRQQDEFPLKVKMWLMKNEHPYNMKAVAETVHCLRSMFKKEKHFFPTVPYWLDGNPNNKVIIFKNGILDIKTRQLQPHTDKLFCPYVLPYAYDPAATCDTWLSCLNYPFENDQQRIALLQEWFGYVLSGETNKQVFMCAYGPPGCMKGTISRVLKRLIGDENATGFHLRNLTNRFGCGNLLSMKLAIVDEIELSGAKDRSSIIEKLKTITGEGDVDLEYKGSNIHISTKLPTRFHLSSNSIPDLKDGTGALMRRCLLLPCYRAIPADMVDDRLFEKLCDELSGITNWALEGYARLCANGKFTLPDESKRQIDNFVQCSAPAVKFIQECCVVDPDINPNNMAFTLSNNPQPSWVKKEYLTTVARQWFVDHDHDDNNFNQVWFYRNLHSILPKYSESFKGSGVDRFKIVNGITLKMGLPYRY